jgi:hypothetical protein
MTAEDQVPMTANASLEQADTQPTMPKGSLFAESVDAKTQQRAILRRKPFRRGRPSGWTPARGSGRPLVATRRDVKRFLQQPTWAEKNIPALLFIAMPTILGIAMLRAAAGAILYYRLRGTQDNGLEGLALAALGLLFTPLPIYMALVDRQYFHQKLRRIEPTILAWSSRILIFGVVFWVALIVWWVLDINAIHRVAAWLGSVGMLGGSLAIMSLVLCALVAVTNAWPAPAPRNNTGALLNRRPPILTLALVCFLLASTLPPQETLHDVLPYRSGAPYRGRSLQEAFDRWRCVNSILPGDAAAPCSGKVVPNGSSESIPLILIASSGGGIRSAVWTAYVLDRVIGYKHIHQVFAMSGVSGGALGIATYGAQLSYPDPKQDPATAKSFPPPDPCNDSQPAAEPKWICKRLYTDSVAPIIGWLMLVEAPWSLVHFDLHTDRARVLERNLERAWSADSASTQGLNANLLQLNAMPKDASEPYVPLLVFNGTAVESGCRVNASVLGANGHATNEPTLRCLSSPYRAANGDPLPKDSVFAATVDLVDLLCADDNLPLSTAALLAGRFPFVSPAGHALQCRQNAKTDSNPLETYIVDGGYLENSGAATALELWTALAPLVEEHNRDSSLPAIVPFFIQIDNGYDEPAASARLPTQMQLIVPFITLGSTLSAHQALASQTAERVFSSPYAIERSTGSLADMPRYAHFVPEAHPGPQAPLGWTLSRASFADLVDQFVTTNQNAQATVCRWFVALKTDMHACDAASALQQSP